MISVVSEVATYSLRSPTGFSRIGVACIAGGVATATGAIVSTGTTGGGRMTGAL